MSAIENLTVMFTDIVGFSEMVSTLSRDSSERLLKLHDKLLKKVIRRFRGTLVKSVGDSFMVTFRSPTDSVLCAMAMQDALWEINQQQSAQEQIQIRIALNTGEVRMTSKDVFGEAVNIASRLENMTPAGSIYLTETVYLTMNRNEVEFEALGGQTFKGIPHPLNIYKALWKKTLQENSESAPFPYGGAHLHLKPANRARYTVGRLFVGISASLVAAFVTWWTTVTYMPGPESIQLDKAEVEYRQPDTISEEEVIVFANDITAEIRSLAEPLLTNNNYLQLKALVKTYIPEYPANPYLQSLQGHVDIFDKNYEQAITHYKYALENNPSLARDALIANNLVRLLDFQRLATNRLIASYLSQSMLDALSQRTGQPGLRGRYDAFYLLKDSGNADRIDNVGLNIWDLRELEECAMKKVAVSELKRLNDPRAIPALKEALDVGLLNSLKYMCYRRDALTAIKQMEAQLNNNNSRSG